MMEEEKEKSGISSRDYQLNNHKKKVFMLMKTSTDSFKARREVKKTKENIFESDCELVRHETKYERCEFALQEFIM